MRDDAARGVEREVLFARLARADDVEAEHARPGHEADQPGRLVAVDRRVDDAMVTGQPIEPRADDRVGFLAHHADVRPAAQRGFGDRRAGLGRAGGLDHHVVRRLRQPVGVRDERDGAAGGAHLGFRGADPKTAGSNPRSQQRGAQPFDVAIAQDGEFDAGRDPALREEGPAEPAVGTRQRDANPAIAQFAE